MGDEVIPRSRARQTRMSSHQQQLESANRLSQASATSPRASPRAAERRSHAPADNDKATSKGVFTAGGGGIAARGGEEGADGASASSGADVAVAASDATPPSGRRTALQKTAGEWAKVAMWWTEDFAHEFLALFTHFVNHRDRTR
jgi:hypothetical protein